MGYSEASVRHGRGSEHHTPSSPAPECWKVWPYGVTNFCICLSQSQFIGHDCVVVPCPLRWAFPGIQKSYLKPSNPKPKPDTCVGQVRCQVTSCPLGTSPIASCHMVIKVLACFPLTPASGACPGFPPGTLQVWHVPSSW